MNAFGKRRARRPRRVGSPKKTPPTGVGGAQGRTTCLTASSVATPGVGAGGRHSMRGPGGSPAGSRSCEAGAGGDGLGRRRSRCVLESWFACRTRLRRPARCLKRPGAAKGERAFACSTLFIGRFARELNAPGCRVPTSLARAGRRKRLLGAEWPISGPSGHGRFVHLARTMETSNFPLRRLRHDCPSSNHPDPGHACAACTRACRERASRVGAGADTGAGRSVARGGGRVGGRNGGAGGRAGDRRGSGVAGSAGRRGDAARRGGVPGRCWRCHR